MTGARIVADSSIAGEAVKIASGFGGLGGGLVFARWFIGWLTGRHDQREAELRAEDGQIDLKWRAYREAIEGRCEMLEGKVERLEKEVDDCHAEKRDLAARVARLEGFASARGEMRQSEQVVSSAQRLIDGDGK